MASAEKWVKGAKPADSAVEVARRVIVKRLGKVWDYLILAATNPQLDIEYVHQLRIATRRATAAIQVFRGLVSNKPRRALMRELRHLRRTAAAARDLDVLMDRLKERANDPRDNGLAEAIAHVQQRRRQSQGPLVRAYKEGKRVRWKQRTRKTAKRKLWRQSKYKLRFGDVARKVLTNVVNDFFAAAAADLSDVDALHQMRICGKRLRYTMEVVCGAFDKSLRTEVYPEFEEVQERIGVVNDHATAARFFSEWYEQAGGQRYGEIFRQLMLEERQLAAATRNEFLAWWTSDRADRLKRRFEELLNVSPTLTGGFKLRSREIRGTY